MTDRTPTEATWKLVPAEPTEKMLKPFGGRRATNGGCNVTGYREMLAASPPAPAAEAVAGWCVTYTDESALLVFTEEEADEAIADARPGAIKRPLYTHPLDAAAIRAETRKEALEEAACTVEGHVFRPKFELEEAARAIRDLAANLPAPPAGGRDAT